MEGITCGIVEDLLPSYCDELTKDSVSQMLYEHLQGCSVCREKYESMLVQRRDSEEREILKGRTFGEKLKKTKRYVVRILIGMILGSITLITVCIVALLFFLTDGPPYVITDATHYEEALSKYEYDDMRSNLPLFPKELPESAEDADFYFSYQFVLDDPIMEIFLQCDYNEEDYETELQRLGNMLELTAANHGKESENRQGHFAYPAYIASNGPWQKYEYALLSGDKQITYVYLISKRRDAIKKVEEKYLPNHYEVE